MRQAYRFRKDETADLDHFHLARLVDIRRFADDRQEGDQYRCRYPPCFGPVHPKPGSHCFAHNDNTAKTFCRYYHRTTPTPKMVAMEVALSELAGTIDIEHFDAQAFEAEFRYPEGQGVLAYLTAEKAERFYKGELKLGREMMFVITLVDLAKLNPAHLRKMLRHCNLMGIPDEQERPADEPAGEPERERAGLPPVARPALVSEGFNWKDLKLVGVTFVRVDWDRLFGLEQLESHTVYLKTPFEPEFRLLNGALSGERFSAEGRKVLRLLAKRVLIEGAALHRCIFRQDRAEARDLTRACETFPTEEDLVDAAELSGLLTDDAFGELLRRQTLLREPFLGLAQAVRERERQERESLQADNERLEGELTDARSKIETLEAHRKKLVEGFWDVRREYFKARRDSEQAREKIAELEGQDEDAHERIVELATKLDGARQRAGALETERDEARGKIGAHETELAEARGKISALETERNKARGKIGALETENDEARGKIETLETDLDEARDKISALETENDEARGKIDVLETELAEARERVAALENELAEARARIAELETDLAEAREKIAALEARNRRLEAVLDGPLLGRLVKRLYLKETPPPGEREPMAAGWRAYLKRKPLWIAVAGVAALAAAAAWIVPRAEDPPAREGPILAAELPDSFFGDLEFADGESGPAELAIAGARRTARGDLRFSFVLSTTRSRREGYGSLDREGVLRISDSESLEVARVGDELLLTGRTGLVGELRGRAP